MEKCVFENIQQTEKSNSNISIIPNANITPSIPMEIQSTTSCFLSSPIPSEKLSSTNILKSSENIQQMEEQDSDNSEKTLEYIPSPTVTFAAIMPEFILSETPTDAQPITSLCSVKNLQQIQNIYIEVVTPENIPETSNIMSILPPESSLPSTSDVVYSPRTAQTAEQSNNDDIVDRDNISMTTTDITRPTVTVSTITSSSEEASSDETRQSQKRKKDLPVHQRKVQKPSDAELGWVITDILPQLPVFQEQSGLSIPLDNSSTEFDCFEVFLPQSMVKHFKIETNKHASIIIAKQRRTKQLKAKSVWGLWKPVKIRELYAFFAIVVHMCIVKKPKLSDYWSKNSFISNHLPSSVMSRNRFKSILSNFYLNNNATYVHKGQPNHDPLHKIRPYFDHLNQAFSSSFQPKENLTVDEGICGFRGRIRFRVYMKNKPEKYGIKLFIVCDACTGYVLNMEVYCGKTDNAPGIKELLKRLLANYLGKGHTIYMDRFYSSPTIFDYLWENKTKAVGTCMEKRQQMPQSVISKKIKQGEIVFMRRNHLLCLKWRDTRDIIILSTRHKAISSTVRVRTKQGIKLKSKPDAILDYNINKIGVDKTDQMVAYYPFKRKQLKWWKKLFFHLFIISITNAFQLYKESRNQEERKKCRLIDFMLKIGQVLVTKSRNQLEQTVPEYTNRLEGRHFIEKIPSTEKKIHPRRICKVCADRAKNQTGKSIRKETSWWCPECQVPLCVLECFKTYHTVANYI